MADILCLSSSGSESRSPSMLLSILDWLRQTPLNDGRKFQGAVRLRSHFSLHRVDWEGLGFMKRFGPEAV